MTDRRKFIGTVTVRYEVEAEDRDAAGLVLAAVAASTEQTGVRSRSGADGVARMVAVKARVKS